MDQTPICDRCHNLLHYHTGESISHPSLQAIEDTISQSPHKHNHVYHILDAADFPMSLVTGIQRQLSFAHLRTKNRRSKSLHWDKGKTWDMSFIITRADVLAPRKEQVDTMMPKMLEILRDALGNTGEEIRLGNVRCVSAKRGWWTKMVKKSIAAQKGGNWLVGKVNVGKSSLFEVVFPKGSENLDEAASAQLRDAFTRSQNDTLESFNATSMDIEDPSTQENFANPYQDIASLLPPAQPETKFPAMPLISDLPGTTASPIRVPFSGGRGELIDLPGLERSTIDEFVKPEHKLDLFMKSRIVPERIVMKPGSSLLLGGGLIRITPTTPDLIILAHAFVPIETHLTSTQKAKAIQNDKRESGIRSILRSASKNSISSAGTFDLNCDVTRVHAGPLTRKDAVGLKTERLPFIVYSTDILIESVGWVELVAQVRRRRKESSSQGTSLSEGEDALTILERAESGFPQVEIFSPKGAFIAQRKTLGAWLVGGPEGKPSQKKAKGRPRASMKNARSRRPKGTSNSS